MTLLSPLYVLISSFCFRSHAHTNSTLFCSLVKMDLLKTLQSLCVLKLQIRGAKYAQIIFCFLFIFLAYISILCFSKCQPDSFLSYFTDSVSEASPVNQGASSFTCIFTYLIFFFWVLFCCSDANSSFCAIESLCLSAHVPLCTYFMYE